MGFNSMDDLLQILGYRFDMRILENAMRSQGYRYHPEPVPVSSYEVDGVQYEVYDKGEI